MPESASGAVSLKEFVPSADNVLKSYDLFIGEGKVTFVPVEASANLPFEEAQKLVLRMELLTQRALVDRFVDRIAKGQDVAEAWLVRESDPLSLAVIVRDLSLDRDLELRAMFADLTYDYDAELRVYAEGDERAELGRRGERLLG
jgi:hypothetical protein